MKKFIFLLLVFIISSFITKTNAQVNINDSLALVDLYNSTNGQNWVDNPGWLTGPINKWWGIGIINNRVVGINLNHNNLSGNLPESIGDLTSLSLLSLDDNNLTGSIPPNVGNLTALTYMYLSSNKLTGSIPESIVNNLVNLQSLSLDNNLLSGDIPQEIDNLTKLKYLFLDHNQLSGNIPENIGNLAALQHLILNNNQLSGGIPENITNLTALLFLDLYGNKLTGNIPQNIGNLNSLQSLYLGNNQLSGNIPVSIGNLNSLQSLYLSDNQLSGSIPESFANLTLTITLGLSSNKLSGKVPSLLNLHKECVAKLANNNFTFEGLEAVVQHFENGHLTYSPQGIIPLHQQGNILYASAGGTLANNIYKWYRNGELFATNIGDSSYIVTTDGAYNVSVTNSICTALTLHSDTITTTVLPLSFLNFTAAFQNNNALLNWSTANEINTKEFIIQRSIDGVEFKNIGKLNAKGNGNSITNYQYIDAGITAFRSNKIYYRLQQQNVNGKSSYSKIIVLNLATAQNSFTVYPNPAKNILHVQSNGKAIYVLHNSTGKILLTKTIDGNGEINITALATGLYYLKNTTTGEVRKVIVQLEK